MKDFGKVAVMLGGESAERDVSLKSGAAVLSALLAAGVDAHAFDPAQKPLTDLTREHFARVFVALHGRGGEDGALQGALDFMKLPYTGSGVLACALAMDKWRSKLVWQAAGLPVPAFEILTEQSDAAAVVKKLGLPLFVKPAAEGSSIGISKVKRVEDLPAARAAAAEHDAIVIAEQFLGGGEYTVGILNGRALPVIRIEPATEFYDYAAKYLRDDTRYVIHGGLSAEQEAAMQQLALAAADLLGCRGWARVDLLTDAAGKPYILEANTAPGMTDHSLVPMAARAAGMSFTSFLLDVLAAARHDGHG